MKKSLILIITIALLMFNSCSSQERMNTTIFFERLSDSDNTFDFENYKCFSNEKSEVYFLKDILGTEYVFEFFTVASGDINKISFACNKTDKAENYVSYLKNIISIYAPEDSAEDVISELTENGKPKKDFSYYTTKWYGYSSYSDKNGMCFSIINNKLTEQKTVEYSLKSNDKSGF